MGYTPTREEYPENRGVPDGTYCGRFVEFRDHITKKSGKSGVYADFMVSSGKFSGEKISTLLLLPPLPPRDIFLYQRVVEGAGLDFYQDTDVVLPQLGTIDLDIDTEGGQIALGSDRNPPVRPCEHHQVPVTQSAAPSAGRPGWGR